MNDGTGPLFDVPSGSMWIHSNVKNCPQLISDALGWYHHAIAHPPPTPSPAVTPPASAPAPRNPYAFNTPNCWSSLCPDGPGGSFSPWDVVFFYYAYVNAGAYSDARALMSPGWQAAQGDYNRWKAGYAGANAGVSIPVAVSVFPGEQYPAPRSWTERAYPNLIYFNEVDKGGHFAAWEQPQLFSEEVRAGFRSLR